MIKNLQQLHIIPNSLGILAVGQMGFLIKGPGGIVAIDLCLSDVVQEKAGLFWERAYNPPVEASMLTAVDYYFITHEHLDHLDPITVADVAKASPDCKFIAPGWCYDLLLELGISENRIIICNTNEEQVLENLNLKFLTIPAAHYDIEFDKKKGHRYVGFHITWNNVTLYHGGDTIIFDNYIDILKSLPPIDVGILATNGRDYYRELDGGAIGNLLPQESARIAKDLEWDLLVPGHNDMFPNNKIPMGEIATALEQIAPRQKYKIFQPGELVYYTKF